MCALTVLAHLLLISFLDPLCKRRVRDNHVSKLRLRLYTGRLCNDFQQCINQNSFITFSFLQLVHWRWSRRCPTAGRDRSRVRNVDFNTCFWLSSGQSVTISVLGWTECTIDDGLSRAGRKGGALAACNVWVAWIILLSRGWGVDREFTVEVSLGELRVLSLLGDQLGLVPHCASVDDGLPADWKHTKGKAFNQVSSYVHTAHWRTYVHTYIRNTVNYDVNLCKPSKELPSEFPLTFLEQVSFGLLDSLLILCCQHPAP